jgi:hypothetical protein
MEVTLVMCCCDVQSNAADVVPEDWPMTMPMLLTMPMMWYDELPPVMWYCQLSLHDVTRVSMVS